MASSSMIDFRQQPIRRRGLMVALSLVAGVALAACGSSPVAKGGTAKAQTRSQYQLPRKWTS